MKRTFTTLLLLFSGWIGYAQEAPVPETRFPDLQGGKTISESVLLFGKSFIGKPYVAHTLEGNAAEQLVVNFQKFDCTTFVESVMGLSFAWHDSQLKATKMSLEETYKRYLTKIRYRNGQLDGYASRLHYFSEWLADNERKGLIRDISRHFPGSMQVSKPVSYMTAATWKYPALQDPAVYKQIVQAEAAISQQAFYFIPKKNLRQAENQLRDGDIIMLTAARTGLDMKHCGFAVWQNGKVYLLHASSDFGMVMLTRQPLIRYVMDNKRLSGIRVARMSPNAQLTALLNE
ncbi:N-acetylmuramoyl-L-alanine amidase-like domain-containing protein [Arsenicibacter rosenii]|uniref:DUF1460 domain-containing protein n=1 Tax=Arsenicibacter rosenii TaxID=1750698 RepID=A0A1S2VQ72_9BACT|nr:N-acetylmuramoyl-L-alanine amidase-like domain-containing protein [Arsenicibacter rosenii]OIN60919.1 hypothetical protein BLX24_02195 [Arsenicibacter rosenii]